MGSNRANRKRKTSKGSRKVRKAEARESTKLPELFASRTPASTSKAEPDPSGPAIGSTAYFIQHQDYPILNFSWKRNGFNMPIGIENPKRLEQAYIKNLVFALWIDKRYKAELHIQSLLIEAFRVMNDDRTHYNLKNESKEAKLSFYQHVLEEVVFGGHLVEHLSKSSPSPNATEETFKQLEILEPHTLLIVVEVHTHGRTEFLKYADDTKRLIIKKPKPATIG